MKFLKCKGEVAMMFQNYALFPHLNVEKNILFALYDKKDKKQILEDLLKTFEIENLRYKKIDEIWADKRKEWLLLEQ